MIERIFAALAELGLQPTAEDVRDGLWLALHLPPGPPALDRPPAAAEETSLPESQTPSSEADRPEGAQEQIEQELHPYPATGAHAEIDTDGQPGVPAHGPIIPGLPGELAIGRALRPLKRRVPSPTRVILDEQETAERSADARLGIPVLQAGPERWLDLALVIDDSPSMVLWQQTASELQQLLERHGAFRDVRAWSLVTDPADDLGEHGTDVVGLRIRTQWTDRGPLRDPRELVDPTGRRLILVVSDGVAAMWRRPALHRVLTMWGRAGPVAIVQMLPEQLWHQTGLAITAAYLRAPRPGAPNGQLAVRPQDGWDLEGNRNQTRLPLPVVPLEPAWMSPWAKLLASSGGWFPGAVTYTGQWTPVQPSQASERQVEPRAKVNRFRMTASPTAVELAAYLAAAAPLTPPVMRLVQQAMLPYPKSEPAHLAEVLLSGLMERPIRTGESASTEPVEFDYMPGVRDLLLNLVPRSDTVFVLRQVGRFLERHDRLQGLTAVITDPATPKPLLIPPTSRPIAIVTVNVLRRLGGHYAEAAARVNRTLDATAQVSAAARHRQSTSNGNDKVALARPAPAASRTGSGVFLSYAEEDSQIALEIAAWLRRQGIEAIHWREPQRRGSRFVQEIGTAISRADAFVALLSPHFLASPWCRWEQELAIQHEVDLQALDSSYAFVQVLQVAEVPYSRAGVLRAYDWLDFTEGANRRRELDVLADRLRQQARTQPKASAAADRGQPSPSFRDRRDELERVVRGLINPSGPHFWLVIAPPGLGKSWFLDRLSAEVAPPNASRSADGPARWAARLIDLRSQPLDARSNVALILASLFGRRPPQEIDAATLRDIAREIIRSGRSCLCLLDSAELLNEQTARIVRSCLSEIYHLVQQAGNSDVRLAFVVASRQEAGWRGVVPDPRLSPLPLTEFKVEVVRQALYDLAEQMQRYFAPTMLQQNADRIHRLSEGLPALLVRCVEWIRREEWQDLDRLEGQELFEQIAKPYIKDLFVVENLFSFGGGRFEFEKQRDALWEAFRVLAPYRLFTQSHLTYHRERDAPLRRALDALGWTIGNLWEAIRGTALLYRPMPEVWQEVYPPIRRLLYRSHYQSDDQRAEAHREARKFMENWTANQAGKEQVKGLVECLWHEAGELWLTRPAELERELLASAAMLSRALKESRAYTVEELRTYAAEGIRSDDDLDAVLGGVPGLFDRLVRTVAAPEEAPA